MTAESRLLSLPASPIAECTSTQDLARRAAEAGAPEGTIVWSLAQSAGRGRSDHTWHSASGLGLWVSLILRPEFEQEAWPALTSLAAIAAAEALSIGAPPGWLAELKWPNDLFGRRGKLGGVLAETTGHAVILGLGLDIGHSSEDFPPELQGSVSSLRLEGFSPLPSLRELLLAFDDRFARGYDAFGRGDRDWLRSGLLARSHTIGRHVRVREGDAVVEGVAIDLGPLGELILETTHGVRAMRGGELLRDERNASAR